MDPQLAAGNHGLGLESTSALLHATPSPFPSFITPGPLMLPLSSTSYLKNISILSMAPHLWILPLI
jgi:hypothetical protein